MRENVVKYYLLVTEKPRNIAYLSHQILSLARLPIPPQAHSFNEQLLQMRVQRYEKIIILPKVYGQILSACLFLD